MSAGRSGFSLIELLLVLLIMTILMGMVFAIGRSDPREEAVRGAAEELASVLRETRERAIRNRTPYGVAFNITNAPGSSGRILNNRSGGHWYRVIGPRDTLYSDPYYIPIDDTLWNHLPLFDAWRSPLNEGKRCSMEMPSLEDYLELVARSWIDEPHVLARNKVRFLALTDQDNGDNTMPSQGGFYTATYPRPWFGWWDAANGGALHAWGGYDPSLTGASQRFLGWGFDSVAPVRVIEGGSPRIASPSGFYYEGWDGTVTGCVNRVDREVLTDSTGMKGLLDRPDLTNPKGFLLHRAGESRPLINGAWLDYLLRFHGDGTVDDDWFRLRQGYWAKHLIDFSRVVRPDNQDPFVPSTYYAPLDMRCAGPMDRTNGCAKRRNWQDTRTAHPGDSAANREATTYVGRTGFYWITLAPDAPDDNHTFASAALAVRSLTPTYRVGVSPHGQVKVIRVRNTYTGPRVFDATVTGSTWQDKNAIWGKNGATWTPQAPIVRDNYINHELRNADGSPRGEPIHDLVLPEMLSDRKWWWAP